MKGFVAYWVGACFLAFVIAAMVLGVGAHSGEEHKNHAFACIRDGTITPGQLWGFVMGIIGIAAAASFIIGTVICLTVAKIRAWKKYARERVDGKRIIWKWDSGYDSWDCDATVHITDTMVKEIESLCGVLKVKSESDYSISVAWGAAFDDKIMKARIGNYIARVGEEGCAAPAIVSDISYSRKLSVTDSPKHCCITCADNKGCRKPHRACSEAPPYEDCVERGYCYLTDRPGGTGYLRRKCWRPESSQPSVEAEPSYVEFEGRAKSIILPPKASQMKSSARHPSVPKHIVAYMMAAMIVGGFILLIWSGIDSHIARQEAVSSEWCVVDICATCNAEVTINTMLQLSKRNDDHISDIPGVDRFSSDGKYQFRIWIADYFDTDEVCRAITEYVDSLAIERGLAGKQ